VIHLVLDIAGCVPTAEYRNYGASGRSRDVQDKE
jgi:hypothetical protein